MEQKFYECRHCGNIVAMIRDNGVSVYCCGEPMRPMTADSLQGSGEKHTPVYRVSENTVFVTVGEIPHPMTREHHISWICLETDQGIQYVHLRPEDPPQARFPLAPGDNVRAIYAFCNQHNLWRN